jgi:hypothetical protein
MSSTDERVAARTSTKLPRKHNLTLLLPHTTSGISAVQATYAMEQKEADEDFKHFPLNLKSRQVRLLKLVPGTRDENHIQAVLQHFDNEEAPPFKALSYTWGKPYPLYTIYVNGKAFSVRQNLYAFLTTATSEPGLCTDVWLWIDQVCIQQLDTKERNHQVQQMPEIYRSASEVIVWLGPGTTYNRHLLREVADVKANPVAWSILTTRAVIQLLSCEYWTRTWVIQEFILAASIVFCWGTTRFGFDELESILDMGAQHIQDRKSRAHSVLRPFGHISELVAQKNKSRPDDFVIRSWKHALTLSSFTNCHDVRDRIYALLGLVDPKIAVYPDYAASPEDIFVDVLTNVAIQYKSLHHDNEEQDDFLATKALVSQALGLGNQPPNRLKGNLFDQIRMENQLDDDACTDLPVNQLPMAKVKTANALREWVTGKITQMQNDPFFTPLPDNTVTSQEESASHKELGDADTYAESDVPSREWERFLFQLPFDIYYRSHEV